MTRFEWCARREVAGLAERYHKNSEHVHGAMHGQKEDQHIDVPVGWVERCVGQSEEQESVVDRGM